MEMMSLCQGEIILGAGTKVEIVLTIVALCYAGIGILIIRCTFLAVCHQRQGPVVTA